MRTNGTELPTFIGAERLVLRSSPTKDENDIVMPGVRLRKTDVRACQRDAFLSTLTAAPDDQVRQMTCSTAEGLIEIACTALLNNRPKDISFTSGRQYP